jgi:hypothetical protein
LVEGAVERDGCGDGPFGDLARDVQFPLGLADDLLDAGARSGGIVADEPSSILATSWPLPANWSELCST